MVRKIRKAIIHAENTVWAKLNINYKAINDNMMYLVAIVVFGKAVLKLSLTWLDYGLAIWNLYQAARKRDEGNA